MKRIDILNFWKTDYNDLRCNALLYKNKKMLANIIVSYDIDEVKKFINKNFRTEEYNDKFINVTFKSMIYEDFDTYLKLPKISSCSNLLKEIYDVVCESESGMCHITYDDWNEDYAERYSTRNLEILKYEIKKYGLEDVLVINECEYKIVGYSNLETKFNDDRKISKTIEYEK